MVSPAISRCASAPRHALARLAVGLGAMALLAGATACTSAATSAGPSDLDAADRSAGAAVDAARADAGGGADESQIEHAVIEARPRTVAMVGDSITVSAAEKIEAKLTALDLDVLAIDAQSGRRMTVGEQGRLYTGADIVEFVSNGTAEPDLWVVALGTNDIGQYGDREHVVEQVEAVLDRMPDDVPVVWIDTWWRTRPDDAAQVNDAIRSVIDRRPGSIVVSWGAHAAANGVVAGDGVHLTTEVGTERFAEVVAGGVESLIGPG